MHSITPDFVPEPIGWGSYKGLPDTHFYLCEFRSLGEELPEPPVFCQKLAELHKNGVSPNGKFGFHVVTYNGNLPQENGFTDTWEEFFANGLKHMLRLNFEAGGPSQQLEDLMPSMFEKVIPRLLRPLETGGNSITPSLVHGDLWCGNAAVDVTDDSPLVFDPCCFWAHNECKKLRTSSHTHAAITDRVADELGNWRPERNRFSRSYFTAYHSHFPKASPEEDYDDRNALYAMQVERFNLQAATLFPDVLSFRKSVVDEMLRLTAKYPGGYEDFVK
ncbi:hypothetical protein MMC22_009065 [Lobaria immixta]|nr:hypothetical protein [Lobaria immixta]